jgi:hypothetical protein
MILFGYGILFGDYSDLLQQLRSVDTFIYHVLLQLQLNHSVEPAKLEMLTRRDMFGGPTTTASCCLD